MAGLQIVRGPAPLPVNVEEQFRRAFGRDMNELERRFYGLEAQPAADLNPQYLPEAA